MERLLRSHAANLDAFVNNRIPEKLRSKFSADDVLQEAWVAAFQNCQFLADMPADRFLRWLQYVSKRILISHIRFHTAMKRQRIGRATYEKADLSTSLVDLFQVVRGADRTPSSLAAQNELAGEVRHALDRLPELSRQVLWMHHIEGVELDEMAARLERTPDAIRGLIFRARKQLADKLSSSSMGDGQ
ncbi:MAG: sigma-70 family RNA polymerase sigma factor [Planctomycetota bacterium]